MTLSMRFGRVTAFSLAALAFAGCATMRVGSYVERGADFARYKTYDWGPPDGLSTGDPRLDNNPFFEARVRADVDRELAARGFERAVAGRPDLQVHYHANISQRLDVHDGDRPEAAADRHDTARTSFYDAGTLVIDLVDTRTRVLAWRGWAEDSVDGTIDDQVLMERKIDDAVVRILKILPRRL